MARSGGLSRYCRALLLASMFGQESSVILQMPTKGWMALSRSAVGQHDNGIMLDEPPATVEEDGVIVDTAYERASIPLGPTTGAWRESGLSSVVNLMDIRFPRATGPWGTIKYWALLDSSTGGSLLAYGALRNKATIRLDDFVIIPPGAISISLDAYDMEW